MKLEPEETRVTIKALLAYERRITNGSRAPMAGEVELVRGVIEKFRELKGARSGRS